MEVVSCRELFELIHRELPGESASALELRCGYAPKSGVFANMKRNRQWIKLETADSILTSLSLSHHLSMGELEITTAKAFLKGGELDTGQPKGDRPAYNRDEKLKKHTDRNSKLTRKVNRLLDKIEQQKAEIEELQVALANALN